MRLIPKNAPNLEEVIEFNNIIMSIDRLYMIVEGELINTYEVGIPSRQIRFKQTKKSYWFLKSNAIKASEGIFFIDRSSLHRMGIL